MRLEFAMLAIFLSCGVGLLAGYHAGWESLKPEIVHCASLEKAPQPGYYVCTPFNQESR